MVFYSLVVAFMLQGRTENIVVRLTRPMDNSIMNII